MPNIAEVLKSEIARVARKELRADTEALKKSQSAHRSDIAALKRRLQDVEKALRQVTKVIGKSSRIAEPPAPTANLRFSAKGLASKRAQLGISASDLGLLVGTTGQSIYGWESGSSRPRAKYLPAIAAVRSMGKREVAARLQELHATS